MKQLFLKRAGHSRLLIFFAGWGMDEHLVNDYVPANSDLMICYDYRSLSFEWSSLLLYSSIDLVAWSMGVWAASHVFDRCLIPINKRIAVNGTVYPVDELKGIPDSIFKGTVDSLNEQNLRKFFRRMCGSSSAFHSFLLRAPVRPLNELKEELVKIGEEAVELRDSSFVWNKAYIGTEDKIFTCSNQLRAWENQCVEIITFDGAHYFEVLFKELLK